MITNNITHIQRNDIVRLSCLMFTDAPSLTGLSCSSSLVFAPLLIPPCCSPRDACGAADAPVASVAGHLRLSQPARSGWSTVCQSQWTSRGNNPRINTGRAQPQIPAPNVLLKTDRFCWVFIKAVRILIDNSQTSWIRSWFSSFNVISMG